MTDFPSLPLTAVPRPPDVVVVVTDTSTRRGRLDSTHNERRRQCEGASAMTRVALEARPRA
jgi:galactokinase